MARSAGTSCAAHWSPHAQPHQSCHKWHAGSAAMQHREGRQAHNTKHRAPLNICCIPLSIIEIMGTCSGNCAAAGCLVKHASCSAQLSLSFHGESNWRLNMGAAVLLTPCLRCQGRWCCWVRCRGITSATSSPACWYDTSTQIPLEVSGHLNPKPCQLLEP